MIQDLSLDGVQQGSYLCTHNHDHLVTNHLAALPRRCDCPSKIGFRESHHFTTVTCTRLVCLLSGTFTKSPFSVVALLGLRGVSY
jgi:hypothetical protein